MTKPSNYKPLFYLIGLLLIAIVSVYLYNKIIVEPNKRIEELGKQNEELKENITKLEEQINQNLTKTETVEVRKVNGWTLFFFLLSIILLILLLLKNRTQKLKLREIIDKMKVYAKLKFNVQVHRLIYGRVGVALGKPNEDVYLILWCTNPHWTPVRLVETSDGMIQELKTSMEPGKYFIYGYYGNAKDPEDIKIIFEGKTMAEVQEEIADMEMGLNRPYTHTKEKHEWESKAQDLAIEDDLTGKRLARIDEAREKARG